MRVLAYVHKYPPDHNAGAEWALHRTLEYLRGRGHEVRVCTSHPSSAVDFQGIPITPRANLRTLATWFDWCSVAITHLDVTRMAMAHASRRNRPLVHLVHNHRQLEANRVQRHLCRLAVFNSRWLAEATPWAGDKMVLYPPVPPDAYRTDGPHDRVLLSNLIAAKGAPLVWAVAALLPSVPFLAVRGAYGAQELPPPDLGNVEVAPQDPDVRVHLARAALLLMPSSYESYGRLAIEAACSGIPTIASHARGLVEALEGYAAHLDVESEGTVERPPPWGVVRPTPETVGAWAGAIVDHLDHLAGPGGDDLRAEIRRLADRRWAETLRQLAELERRLLEFAV